MTLPTHPPATIEAGTTVAFTQSAVSTSLGTVSPDEGWSLVWHVRSLSNTVVGSADVTATSLNNLWTVTLTAAVSRLLNAGGYQGVLRATKSAETVSLYSHRFTITPNIVDAPAGSLQTWAEKTLAVVEVALSGVLEGEMKMYMIGGRQVMTLTPDELRRERSRLIAEIAAQSGKGFGTPIRFDVVGMR